MMSEMQAVALVIYRSDKEEELLSVKRPEDDDENPGAWGLPATEKREGESWEDAVHRAAEEKLGVDVEFREMMSEGGQARDGYNVVMRNYKVEIDEGEPDIDAEETEGTDYTDWSWRPPTAFSEDASSPETLWSTMLLDNEDLDYLFDQPHNLFKMEHQDDS